MFKRILNADHILFAPIRHDRAMIDRRHILRALQDDELPEAVKNCEKSVREDNPDMDRSTAIAICRDMHQRGVLADYLEAAPDGARANQRAMAEFRNPAEIRRVEEGSGVRYKRVMLLSPGTWADAGSEEFVEYNSEAIAQSADNWVDLDAIRAHVPNWQRLTNSNRAERLAEMGSQVMLDEAAPINFLHGPAMYGADSLDEIGKLPLDSIIVDEQGRLYGDLVLDGQSPQSKTAIELVDEVLEAAQTKGADPPPVGPSVEIPADRTSMEDGVKSLEEAFFSAVGIVFGPASRPVELGEQARERAVAMAGQNTRNGGVVLRQDRDGDAGDTDGGSTPKTVPRHRRAMTAFDPSEMNDEELAETLRTMQEDMTELEAALQEGEAEFDIDPGMAQQAISQEAAQRAGEDMSESEAQAEIVSELAEASGRDEDTIRAIAGGEIDAVPDEVAEAMADVLDVDMGDLGAELDEEMSEHDKTTMEDIQEVKNVVGEVAGHLSDISDMLQAREDERETEIDELERRLSELEDEPVQRSLTGEQDSGEFLDEDDDDVEADAGDGGATGRPMF